MMDLNLRDFVIFSTTDLDMIVKAYDKVYDDIHTVNSYRDNLSKLQTAL